MSDKVENTQYGFEWGKMKVERMASGKQTKVICVSLGKTQIYVEMSPRNYSIVIWDGEKTITIPKEKAQ